MHTEPEARQQKMKLSCLPVSLYPSLTQGSVRLEDWFTLAAQLGLDGADVSVAHLPQSDPGRVTQLQREAETRGIRIPVVVTYSDFGHPDALYRADQLSALCGWIRVAADLGASFVRVTAGQTYAGVQDAVALGWAAAAIESSLDAAKAAGVRLLYENHVRGYLWDCNDFTQPSATYLSLLDRVPRADLQVLFDIANPLALGEDSLALLNRVRDRLGAVHISDMRGVGTFQHTVVGTGAAPIREALGVLVGTDYDGWLSIEEASRTGEAGFRAAVSFVDREWVAAGGRARARLSISPGEVAG